MLNCKLFSALIFIAFATGCKPTAVTFNAQKDIDSSFFSQVTGIIHDKKNDDGKKGQIQKIQVYKAVLENITIERDAVAENKLINSKSKEPVLDAVTVYGYHELYFFRLFTTSKQDDDLFIFMASTFNKSGQCIKLGPVYMGKVRMDELNVSKELHVTKKNDSTFYLAKPVDRRLTFFADALLNKDADKICTTMNEGDSACRIKITRIVNRDINKIGGEKFLIYNTSKVFGDEDALVFTYTGIIKK